MNNVINFPQISSVCSGGDVLMDQDKKIEQAIASGVYKGGVSLLCLIVVVFGIIVVQSILPSYLGIPKWVISPFGCIAIFFAAKWAKP